MLQIKYLNMKKETNLENTYITPPLGIIIKWWRGKSKAEAKTGSFNYDLYLAYLSEISK